MSDYRFGPAAPGESVVYGACAPPADPDQWIRFVRDRGIERVCSLLSGPQLERRDGLVERYRRAFGSDRVEHVPIPDGHLPSETSLDRALSVLTDADRAGEPVVVHCLAGLGRTGVVLAAWLVATRGYDPGAAVETVAASGRAPTEAVGAGTATRRELLDLLAAAGDRS